MSTKPLSVLFAGLLALAVVTPVAAGEPIYVEMLGPGGSVFVNGGFSWGFNAYGLLDAEAFPVSASMAWGDGTTTSWSSSGPDAPFWCDSGTCSGWLSHIYMSQGFMPLTLTVSQAGKSAGTATWDQLVIDLAMGGSMSGRGTVWATFGGMYDTSFAGDGGGLATFKLDAKRRAGTSTTTASLTVSVPSMTPEYSGATGMTFTGKSPLEPLYVTPGPKKNTGEVFLGRIYGAVTNSKGPAGTAYATVHVRVVSRTTTLVRIHIWNTDAGYTYLDTGWLDAGSPGPVIWIDPTHDLLMSGAIGIK